MLNKLDAALGTILVSLMAMLVASVTWQVISRYALTQPSAWTEEAARFLLIWISVLGSAYAYRTRAHLAIDILPRKLGPLGAARVEALSAVLVALFAVTVMLIGGGRLVLMTWELQQTSPALALPMAVVYGVIPLSGALLVLFSVQRFWTEWRGSLMGSSLQSGTVVEDVRR
jgi:TRAP-type C4-dicarboxylate transport system permease small subunit